MKLNSVFGVSSLELATYITRSNLISQVEDAFDLKRQLIIHGNSKQGKTTLINKILSEDEKLTIYCEPTFDILALLTQILKTIDFTLESVNYDNKPGENSLKYFIKGKIPGIFEMGIEKQQTTDNNNDDSTIQKQIDFQISSAQDIANIMKRYFPRKIIVLENFHFLKDDVKNEFATMLRTFQDLGLLVVILGVFKEADALTQSMGDLQQRIVTLTVEPWTNTEMNEIISLGEKALNIDMSTIRGKLIEISLGSVGILQDLCRYCCWAADIRKTCDTTVSLTSNQLDRAIIIFLDQGKSRFVNAIRTFGDSKQKTTQDGTKGYGMPYFLTLAVMTRINPQKLKKGVHRSELKKAILSLRNRPDNLKQFESTLTQILMRLALQQKNKRIDPPIFVYNQNAKMFYVTDHLFLFYLIHANLDDLAQDLALPPGFVRNNMT